MIIAINYSDENFRDAQKLNTKTAYTKGRVDKVIEYSPKDIDSEFYKKYEDILNCNRGGGYWLWKPYIILKTMNSMDNGDYLFYCDSGAAYINKVEYLIDSLEKSNQDIMPFELPLIEKQWTKTKTFELMGCNKSIFKENNQILATYILIKVSENSRKFIEQYLKFCTNKDCLIDSNETEKYLIEHRHDQSIFSLLCKKAQLDTFRDPSQYGIRSWEYMANSRSYVPRSYTNSDYPQILVSFRKSNGKKYILKDRIKSVMTKIGILNENQFIRKNKIKI